MLPPCVAFACGFGASVSHWPSHRPLPLPPRHARVFPGGSLDAASPPPARAPHWMVRPASGALLHPRSLPGPSGSGDLGARAHAFADFLAAAAQSWWQMLPVGPIGPANSPYQSLSSFAGNPLLVSLETLVEAGLLEPGDERLGSGER